MLCALGPNIPSRSSIHTERRGKGLTSLIHPWFFLDLCNLNLQHSKFTKHHPARHVWRCESASKTLISLQSLLLMPSLTPSNQFRQTPPFGPFKINQRIVKYLLQLLPKQHVPFPKLKSRGFFGQLMRINP